jgi:hypothetical protein
VRLPTLPRNLALLWRVTSFVSSKVPKARDPLHGPRLQ